MNAKQVPLHELLSSIPADARLVIDDPDGKGTRFIPVGRYCQEAAAALAEPTCKDHLHVEPVAWMDVDDRGNMLSLRFWSEGGHEEVPLYTHPAPQHQPLTDEEIIAANYPDGEEVEPIIAAPDSELIAFSRAVMAVQRDKKGRPIAYWSGLTEARKDDTTRPQRQPLTDEQIHGIGGQDGQK